MKGTKSKLIIGLLVVLVLLGVVAVIGLMIAGRGTTDWVERVSGTGSVRDYWVQDKAGWRAVKTPPACPEPLTLATLVDMSRATSVLYPGQMRSVGYEPTAGFRFDGVANDAVTVKAPMAGEVVAAARFLVGGETQYVFDILSPCGIMNRLDHLLVLAPKFQEIAETLPEPRVNDSRSTAVNPPVKVASGEVIATGVGIRQNNNTFVSWTVFDFRSKNKISQDSSWAATHPELYHYGICPFPYLPETDQKIVKDLPAADSMSGSQSDFCD